VLYPLFVYSHLQLVTRDFGADAREFHRRFSSRGSHSFPFQLNLSASVYRIIQLNS